MIILYTFLGCLPTMQASITAIIEDNNGLPLSSAEVTVHRWDGSILSEVTTDSEGVFSSELPPYQVFYVVAETPNHPPTSFTGYSGEGDDNIPAGTLSIRSYEEVQLSLSDFGECYTEDNFETGSVIEGQAKLYISGTAVDDLPTMTTGTASIIEEDVTIADGCYIPHEDEDGTNIESTQTGESGRYAIFSSPTGVTELTITITVDGEQISYPYSLYVPENGIAPLFPTLVPFLEQ